MDKQKDWWEIKAYYLISVVVAAFMGFISIMAMIFSFSYWNILGLVMALVSATYNYAAYGSIKMKEEKEAIK